MEKKFCSPGRFQFKECHKEKTTGASLTVPEESYTIRELMEKYSRHALAERPAKQPSYDSGASFDSPDLEKVNDLDLYEREEFRRALAWDIAQRKKALEDSKNPTPPTPPVVEKKQLPPPPEEGAPGASPTPAPPKRKQGKEPAD